MPKPNNPWFQGFQGMINATPNAPLNFGHGPNAANMQSFFGGGAAPAGTPPMPGTAPAVPGTPASLSGGGADTGMPNQQPWFHQFLGQMEGQVSAPHPLSGDGSPFGRSSGSVNPWGR